MVRYFLTHPFKERQAGSCLLGNPMGVLGTGVIDAVAEKLKNGGGGGGGITTAARRPHRT